MPTVGVAGLAASPPAGNLTLPVPVNTVTPVAGVKVISPVVLVMVLSLILKFSISTLPVPAPLNCRFELVVCVVIKLFSILMLPSTLIVELYTVFQFLAALPRLYVLVVCGMMSLVIAATMLKVSVV